MAYNEAYLSPDYDEMASAPERGRRAREEDRAEMEQDYEDEPV